MNVSQYRDRLAGMNLSSAEVDRLIKGAIDSGEITDDDATGAIDPAALETMAAAMRDQLAKGSDADDQGDVTDLGVFTDDDITDGWDDEGDYGDDPRVEAIAKGADAIVAEVQERYGMLAKGWLAHGKLYGEMAKGMNVVGSRLDAVEHKLDAILKGLRMPVPPRSVTGMVEAVEQPGEAEAAGNSLLVVREKVLAKGHAILADESASLERRHAMARAIARMDAGDDPRVIANEYNIPLDA